MRCLRVLALAALVVAPRAVHAKAWTDWVGDWSGKLTWTGCIVDGPATATFSVDAIDGVMSIELAPTGFALDAMTLVEDDEGWMGQHGNATVWLSRTTSGLSVILELDSGCTMRGKLARATTKLPACDTLVAWSRIESHCGKLVKPPLELPARLARQRDKWLSARGEDRDKILQQCSARAQKVELQLVDAGCAPNPDPAIGMRGAQCQSLRQLAARFDRCRSAPPDLRAQVGNDASGLISALQSADSREVSIVEAGCRELRTRIAEASKHYSCPP